MDKISPQQQQVIKNNVCQAVTDISRLNTHGYNFLYLCNGFIAHYNLAGFIEYYTNEADLRNDILGNVNANQYRNFKQGDKDFDYYMSKKDLYNLICSTLKGERQ